MFSTNGYSRGAGVLESIGLEKNRSSCWSLFGKVRNRFLPESPRLVELGQLPHGNDRHLTHAENASRVSESERIKELRRNLRIVRAKAEEKKHSDLIEKLEQNSIRSQILSDEMLKHSLALRSALKLGDVKRAAEAREKLIETMLNFNGILAHFEANVIFADRTRDFPPEVIQQHAERVLSFIHATKQWSPEVNKELDNPRGDYYTHLVDLFNQAHSGEKLGLMKALRFTSNRKQQEDLLFNLYNEEGLNSVRDFIRLSLEAGTSPETMSAIVISTAFVARKMFGSPKEFLTDVVQAINNKDSDGKPALLGDAILNKTQRARLRLFLNEGFRKRGMAQDDREARKVWEEIASEFHQASRNLTMGPLERLRHQIGRGADEANGAAISILKKVLSAKVVASVTSGIGGFWWWLNTGAEDEEDSEPIHFPEIILEAGNDSLEGSSPKGEFINNPYY